MELHATQKRLERHEGGGGAGATTQKSRRIGRGVEKAEGGNQLTHGSVNGGAASGPAASRRSPGVLALEQDGEAVKETVSLS